MKRGAPKATVPDQSPVYRRPKTARHIQPFDVPVSKFDWMDEDKPTLGEIFGADFFGEPAANTPPTEVVDLEEEVAVDTTELAQTTDVAPTETAVTTKTSEAGWDNRRGAWWKTESGIKTYSTDLKVKGKQVVANFKTASEMFVVPIPGIKPSELPEALANIHPKYAPTAAVDKTKQHHHPILHEGAFTHTHRETPPSAPSPARPAVLPFYCFHLKFDADYF